MSKATDYPSKSRTVGANAETALSAAAAGHLRSAFDQMELLLKTPHTDAGLSALVALLQHMQQVREAVLK